MHEQRLVGGGIQLTDWLRRSRTRKCDLAMTLGISRPYLSQILHGARRPALEMLVRIADATGIPIIAWADSDVSRPGTCAKETTERTELATR